MHCGRLLHRQTRDACFPITMRHLELVVELLGVRRPAGSRPRARRRCPRCPSSRSGISYQTSGTCEAGSPNVLLDEHEVAHRVRARQRRAEPHGSDRGGEAAHAPGVVERYSRCRHADVLQLQQSDQRRRHDVRCQHRSGVTAGRELLGLVGGREIDDPVAVEGTQTVDRSERRLCNIGDELHREPPFGDDGDRDELLQDAPGTRGLCVGLSASSGDL